MRRPAPKSLAEIRHPGPKAADRRPFIPCAAEAVSFEIASDRPLLEALGHWAEAEGIDSAILNLGGVALAPFDYVMPDRAIDDRHAAWYSDTRSCEKARLEEAVAVFGWRDGGWFAHIHAFWLEGGQKRLGHLLPDTLTLATTSTLTGYGLKGARFEAAFDPETEFTLFRVKETVSRHSGLPINALIATLAPFEDIHQSVESLAATLGTPAYEVMGLGSFAGASFHDTASMTGLISEILLRPGAGSPEGKGLSIPVRCVDLDGNYHQGTVLAGQAPTLVTCELLIRSEDSSP
ncbi:hypothetical protein [Roseibium sp.]|uniref:hypothetical protein n=1 Tax=Roseibium sp. TaxID=1936156 RepID=UPI003BB11D0A